MTKKINLTQNKKVLVDDNIYEYLSQWKWYARKDLNTFYAQRSGKFIVKQQKHMHRLIMNCPDDMEVDHINGDGLDNRKENLRICTHAENSKNTRMHKDNKYGFRGISWINRINKYQVRIRKDGKEIYLGVFEDILDAATAYDIAAKEFYGEYANLNFST